MTKNKSLVKNTIFLLFKIIITIISNLYISRVVLSELGVEDFGIYNVVTGFVIMLTMITGSLSTAVSRFINYEMGKGVEAQVSMVYSASLIFHGIISLIVVIFASFYSEKIVYDLLNISEIRQNAATIVIKIAIVSFVMTLISVTYISLIVANEDMKAFAFIGFFEILIKLIFIYILGKVNSDKLLVYSVFQCISTSIIALIYIMYCRIKYRTLSFSTEISKDMLYGIFKFVGWNSIGSSSFILREQGVNILINIFFGATINAARAVAYQVNSAIRSVVNNLMLAFNPRITKLYASGATKESITMAFATSRYCYYFMLCMVLPVIFNVEFLLGVWLIDPPKYTNVFVVLILISALIDSLSGPLITLMLAQGDIKNYQLVVGLLNLLNLPGSYLLIKLGFPVESTLYLAIFLSIILLFARLFMLAQNTELSITDFSHRVLTPVIFVTILSILFSKISNTFIASISFDIEFARHVISIVIITISTVAFSIFIGLDLKEISNIRNLMKKRIG